MTALFSKKNVKKERTETPKVPKETAPSPEATRTTPPASSRKHQGREAFILLKPHITEKATAKSDAGVYVFVVANKANKPQIRRAVEFKYGVHVKKVNVVNTAGKKPKRFRVGSLRLGFKKAVVTLRKGETIELT